MYWIYFYVSYTIRLPKKALLQTNKKISIQLCITVMFVVSVNNRVVVPVAATKDYNL